MIFYFKSQTMSNKLKIFLTRTEPEWDPNQLVYASISPPLFPILNHCAGHYHKIKEKEIKSEFLHRKVQGSEILPKGMREKK